MMGSESLLFLDCLFSVWEEQLVKQAYVLLGKGRAWFGSREGTECAEGQAGSATSGDRDKVMGRTDEGG